MMFWAWRTQLPAAENQIRPSRFYKTVPFY